MSRLSLMSEGILMVLAALLAAFAAALLAALDAAFDAARPAAFEAALLAVLDAAFDAARPAVVEATLPAVLDAALDTARPAVVKAAPAAVLDAVLDAARPAVVDVVPEDAPLAPFEAACPATFVFCVFCFVLKLALAVPLSQHPGPTLLLPEEPLLFVPDPDIVELLALDFGIWFRIPFTVLAPLPHVALLLTQAWPAAIAVRALARSLV